MSELYLNFSQLNWFACNSAFTLVLTFFVKLSLAVINFYHALTLGNVSIVKNESAFIATISTIFATRVLSQILFFLMKCMPSALEDPIELETTDP